MDKWLSGQKQIYKLWAERTEHCLLRIVPCTKSQRWYDYTHYEREVEDLSALTSVQLVELVPVKQQMTLLKYEVISKILIQMNIENKEEYKTRVLKEKKSDVASWIASGKHQCHWNKRFMVNENWIRDWKPSETKLWIIIMSRRTSTTKWIRTSAECVA